MQTREMKREYEVAVLDPAGNVTAIVLSDVPAAERARIAARLLRLPELRIEQAAFLTAPRCGGEIRAGQFAATPRAGRGFILRCAPARRGKPAFLPRSAGRKAFSRSWRTQRRGRRPR